MQIHPEQVMPAIMAALETRRRSISSFGEGMLLLNPRVATPGAEMLTEDPASFAVWRIADRSTLEFFLQQLSCQFDMLEWARS